ncbi:MAG: prepilin-type N-terminal cleavage/methylation domain-containing protein, partial [Planctomycetia bacterium]|nr:prepilin-type N-terminal cleavage/methylation domain-containing protein [Planctomycetia bacterium]
MQRLSEVSRCQSHRDVNSRRFQRGFTLTELLVVIVIITLLASITSYVILSARDTAKASVVKMQMAQLSMALDAYKKEYGEYPPDFSDTNAVMRHVQKRWPRYGVTDYVQFRAHIAWGSKLSALADKYKGNLNFTLNLGETSNFWNFSNNANFMNLDPAPCCYASALVFWLGGLPGANGTPVGFFHNPKAP